MQSIRKHDLGLMLLLLGSMLLLALCAPVKAFAADPIDVDSSASLRVEFLNGDEPAPGVEFQIYRVAKVNRATEFTLVEPFVDYPISVSNPTAETYRAMATLLPGYIAADKVNPYATAMTGTDGVAEFDGIETGLYLVTGKVYHGYREYVTPEAFMVSVPERMQEDAWNYNVTSMVKPSSKPDAEPVDLSVMKVWQNDSASARPAAVTVELYDGDKLFDTVKLSKENNWFHEWTGLYGGTVWSVREVDIPSGYTVSVDKQDSRFVVTNTGSGSTTPKGSIPQTGMLWWPVPVLAVAGVLFIAWGVCRRNRIR